MSIACCAVSVEQLRHRGQLGDLCRAGVVGRGRGSHELPRRLDSRRHLGERVRDRLELTQRLTEGTPLRRMGDRRLQRCLRHADRRRRSAERRSASASRPGSRRRPHRAPPRRAPRHRRAESADRVWRNEVEMPSAEADRVARDDEGCQPSHRHPASYARTPCSSASGAFEIHFLTPVKRQPLPSRSATRLIAETSEPASARSAQRPRPPRPGPRHPPLDYPRA